MADEAASSVVNAVGAMADEVAAVGAGAGAAVGALGLRIIAK